MRVPAVQERPAAKDVSTMIEKKTLREGRCAVKTIFVAMVCILKKRRGIFL
jgi:hypothetical protein